MSIEAVKNFYERIANDEDFQNKLNELQDRVTEGLEFPLVQDKKEEIIKDVIIPFAEEQGFDFSIEDIKEFDQSIVEQLDDEQLENISAGGGAGRLVYMMCNEIGSRAGGLGSTMCKVIGIGSFGWGGKGGGGFCMLLGFGWGCGFCVAIGSTSSTTH